MTQLYTAEVEVCGAHYVTIPELRTERGLESSSNVPLTLLLEVRDEVEDKIEEIAGVAYVRRYHRDRLDGNGTNTLRLTRKQPREVLSVTIDDVTQDPDEFDLYDEGFIQWRNGSFPMPGSSGYRNCAIAIEHGHDAPPPRWNSGIKAIIRQRVIDKTSERRPDVMYEAFGEGAGTKYLTFEQQVEKLVGRSDERLWFA